MTVLAPASTYTIRAVNPFVHPQDRSSWFLLGVETNPHVLFAHPFWYELYRPKIGDKVLVYKTTDDNAPFLGSLLRYSPKDQRYDFVNPTYTQTHIPFLVRLRATIINWIRKIHPTPKVEPEQNQDQEKE